MFSCCFTATGTSKQLSLLILDSPPIWGLCPQGSRLQLGGLLHLAQRGCHCVHVALMFSGQQEMLHRVSGLCLLPSPEPRGAPAPPALWGVWDHVLDFASQKSVASLVPEAGRGKPGQDCSCVWDSPPNPEQSLARVARESCHQAAWISSTWQHPFLQGTEKGLPVSTSPTVPQVQRVGVVGLGSGLAPEVRDLGMKPTLEGKEDGSCCLLLICPYREYFPGLSCPVLPGQSAA